MNKKVPQPTNKKSTRPDVIRNIAAGGPQVGEVTSIERIIESPHFEKLSDSIAVAYGIDVDQPKKAKP